MWLYLNPAGTFLAKITRCIHWIPPSYTWPCTLTSLVEGEASKERNSLMWSVERHIKLTDAELDFLYTSDGLTNWRLLLGERCPGTQSQQTSVDGPRCENGDERAMVTSPPRSPRSPQTDLRDGTPSPPSGPNNACSNGPTWTDDAGLDNPAFEESTEEDSESISCRFRLPMKSIKLRLTHSIKGVHLLVVSDSICLPLLPLS